MQRSMKQADGVAADPVTAPKQLVLVTKEDCEFCGRAHRLLDALGLDVLELSVYSDEAAQLVARGIPLAFLPVLTDGERLIAYGRFSEKRLRREFGL